MKLEGKLLTVYILNICQGFVITSDSPALLFSRSTIENEFGEKLLKVSMTSHNRMKRLCRTATKKSSCFLFHSEVIGCLALVISCVFIVFVWIRQSCSFIHGQQSFAVSRC